jgi:hypothetical protein
MSHNSYPCMNHITCFTAYITFLLNV